MLLLWLSYLYTHTHTNHPHKYIGTKNVGRKAKKSSNEWDQCVLIWFCFRCHSFKTFSPVAPSPARTQTLFCPIIRKITLYSCKQQSLTISCQTVWYSAIIYSCSIKQNNHIEKAQNGYTTFTHTEKTKERNITIAQQRFCNLEKEIQCEKCSKAERTNERANERKAALRAMIQVTNFK